MADFDESAIRSPRQPVQSIRTDDLAPWMVWTAGAAIAAMALLGVFFGLRGARPLSGVSLTLAPGVAINGSTAASATPAVALPKDQQWSTLSGPEVLPTSAASPKSAAANESDSGVEASSEPAAVAAVDQAEQAPSLIPTPPPAAPQAPAQPPPSTPSDNEPGIY
jgi:hypothetical protein